MPDTNILGYSVDVEEMKASTCGMIGTAKKSGSTYFCKKFNNPVEPAENGALSAKAIAKNRAAFEAFKRRKLRINRTLREIAGPGGNIVYPIEETVFDHHWFEFTDYIEGALPDEQYATVINSLDDRNKLMVLKVAMAALQTIHGQKIVHGDLKLTNIMLVKNPSGIYASKIIDFDGAFFEDDVPLDSITGTVDYYSPELAYYSSYEDPEIREKLSKMMTTKSDIFTMGLILHEYLTGAKPQPDYLPTALQKRKDAGKFIYPWQVVWTNNKGERKPQLVVSDKITEPAYIALISDMLCLEPERRPAAAEVMKRLNNKEVPIEDTPWPEDTIVINRDAAARTLVALRKMEVPQEDKPALHVYEVVEKDGRRYLKSAEELISAGIAAVGGDIWENPWPEDLITWNMEKLKGTFISLRRGAKQGTYQLYDKRGGNRIMAAGTMKMLGLAHAEKSGKPAESVKKKEPEPTVRKDPAPKSPVSKVTSELWPEDAALKLDKAQASKFGMEFVEKATMNGINGYRFKMSKGDIQFWTVQKCKMMRILVPR